MRDLVPGIVNFKVVIPARYASHRLPGKMLLDIAGKPMIQHVYERTQESDATQVIVATDDERILQAIVHFGGKAVMTEARHYNGTERLAEAVEKLGFGDDDIIVNVQGDEPLIDPTVINQVAENLHNTSADMATLCEPIAAIEDVMNPDVVKVIFNKNKDALYFSRAPIPWDRKAFASADKQLELERDPKHPAYFRHIGIYAYRVSLVKAYRQWPSSDIERIERLEQLRAMYYGAKIHVDIANASIMLGIDNADDLARAREYFEQLL